MFSCNRRAIIPFMDVVPESDDVEHIDGMVYQKCNADDYHLDVAFAEDAFDYLIFHVRFTNYSLDSIYLSFRDFEMDLLPGDRLKSERTLPAINVDDYLNFLDNEQDQLKKQKKNRTIGNLIIAGLDAVSIAAGSGGNLGAALSYAAESSIYIAEERNAFRVAELSIEDEKEYLLDWVLYDAYVLPEDHFDFDIIFDRLPIDANLSLTSEVGNQECIFRFSQSYLSR